MKAHFRKIIWIVFLIYIACMMYFLFFSESYGRTDISGYRYNLKPFSEITRYIRYHNSIGNWHFILNIIGNVVAFVPLGLFMPVLVNSYRHFFTTFFGGILFSLCIETIQLVFKVGSFDIDDVLLNVCGIIIGFLLFHLFVCIRNKVICDE